MMDILKMDSFMDGLDQFKKQIIIINLILINFNMES